MRALLLFISFFFLNQTMFSQFFEQTNGFGPGGVCEAIFAEDDLILTSVDGKLFRSTNGGESFDYVFIEPYGNVTPRTFSRIENVIVMGAIDGDRIYRSLDDGASWQVSNEGGPTISGFPAAVPITSCTLGPDVFMCGTNFIRKSSDLGQTWESMDIDGLCLDISETNGNIWATPGGNLHKSTDSGASWEDVSDEGIFFSNSSTDVLETEDVIYVCTSLSGGNGLYESTDGGLTYSLSGSFNIGNKIEKYNDKLFLTHIGGLSVSNDNGSTWEDVVGVGGLVGYSGDLAFDGNETVWVSTTNGLAWVNINTLENGFVVLPVGNISEVAVANTSIFGVQNGALYQSYTNGDLWNEITSGLTSELITISDVYADGQEVYVSGLVNGSAVFFSSMDGGVNFSQVSLPSEVTDVQQVLSFNPVILATLSGGFMSLDEGSSFSIIDLKDVNGNDVEDNVPFETISQNNSSIFLAGSSGGAYSHDDGQSWTFLPMSNLVKLSGWEGRLIRHCSAAWPPFKTEESTDGGVTWTELTGYEQQFSGPAFMWMMQDKLYLQNDQSNFQAGKFNVLTQSSSSWELDETLGSIPDQVISASTNDSGVVLLGTQNSVAWLAGGMDNSILEVQGEPAIIYPNPTSGLIHWNIESLKGDSDVEVVDSFGKVVWKEKAVSNFVDLSEIPKGVYLMRLTNSTKVYQFRLLLR